MSDPDDEFEMLKQHAQRLSLGAAGFAADMKAQGIHVGMGNPARCVNCGKLWPCPAEEFDRMEASK